MKLRAMVTLAVAVLAAAFVAPAQAGATPQALAYPPAICPTLSVSTTHPLPGERITVSGVDFTPNATVHLVLHSKTYNLATVTANGQGEFTTQVTLPSGVVGRHEIVAVSGFPQVQGCPPRPIVVIYIHAPEGTSAGHNPGSGGTSFTGVDVLLILIAAALLIAAGVALNRGGRRRHSAADHT